MLARREIAFEKEPPIEGKHGGVVSFGTRQLQLSLFGGVHPKES
jgi:hypothetical protein